MADVTDFLKAIKRAALEAVEASKPVTVCRGKVQSVSPLKISVGQKMILSEKQLIRLRTAEKIAVSDECLLLREQGGQKYVILGVV